ncbi:MAG: ExbD/TolR family protein [Ruegeria sp.]
MSRTRLPEPRKAKAIDSSLAIVNIVLLLIFFFLTTGSLMSSRTIEVNLPDTTELPLDLLPSPLLTVDNEGALMLDGEPIELAALSDALVDSPRLHVLADRDLGAEMLLTMLDDAALIAVEVRLVTLHIDGGDNGGGE